MFRKMKILSNTSTNVVRFIAGSRTTHSRKEGSTMSQYTVRVACSDNGVTKWQRDDTSKKRFIFHVRDTDNYQSAMTRAMKTLLMTLP